jgi:hypothetical protein
MLQSTTTPRTRTRAGQPGAISTALAFFASQLLRMVLAKSAIAALLPGSQSLEVPIGNDTMFPRGTPRAVAYSFAAVTDHATLEFATIRHIPAVMRANA